MAEPHIRVYLEGGVWIRQLVFAAKGDCHAGHYHSHDHMTLIAHGAVRVAVEGVVTDFTAPHVVLVTANKKHDLTALEAGTVAYCVAAETDVVQASRHSLQ